MGKRSTNTTKSGKFMNPTDQARKEARKKELKKNKKQRQMVRTAVLKGKNPHEIVRELEKLDDMEFNVFSAPPLNDKVMREKRRKLHETWNRVIHMYEKDDQPQYIELKKLWHNYLSRKRELMQQFEAVKNTENVLVDEIPLPSATGGENPEGPEGIPLPPGSHTDAWKLKGMPSGGILKKPSALDSLKPKTCPGPPAALPPKLEDYEMDPDEGEGQQAPRESSVRFDKTASSSAPAKSSLDPAQQIQLKMVALAGQDIDLYMKKLEEVHKSSSGGGDPSRSVSNHPHEEGTGAKFAPTKPDWMPGPPPPPPSSSSTTNISGAPLHQDKPKSVSFKPNELFPPGVVPPGVQLPPGPPPPMMRHPPFPDMGMGAQRSAPPTAPAAAPVRPSYVQKTSSIIEAKPQMRNLKSISTRFVPTNVKLRKQTGRDVADPMISSMPQQQHQQQQQMPRAPPNNNAKDDAYAQFMSEMNKLLH